MASATTGARTTRPGAAARVPGGRSTLRTRDWLFATGFTLYVGFALAVLALGIVSKLAGGSDALHDELHLLGLGTGLVNRVAEAMADAAHFAQPGLQLAVDYGFSVLNLGLAGLLIWLKPRDLTARLLATGMVATSAIFNLQAHGVYEALDATAIEQYGNIVFHLVGSIAYLAALLLFPDGELVPRWSRARRWTLYVPATALVLLAGVTVESTSRVLAVIIVFGLLAPAVGVGSQLYRFRRSQTPVERQQSRLLLFALSPALVLSTAVLLEGRMSSAQVALEGRGLEVIPIELFRVFQPVFAIIPLALIVGLLRFRLWNTDRLISRAIVYSLLAGFVTAVYVVVVVGLGALVDARGDNVVLSIAATGAVAVAFEPVKSRLQRLANRLVYGKRATPYEVLSAFSERLSEVGDQEERLSQMVRLLAEGTGARRADAWLVVGDELRPEASWPVFDGLVDAVALGGGGLPPLPDVTATAPVRHQGELLGVLTVTLRPNEQLGPTEEKLLTDLASQAGLVLRNQQLTAQLRAKIRELRASRKRLVAAQDEGRRRLERNLHDGAQQQLVALRIRIGLAEKMAQQGRDIGEVLQQLNHDMGDAIDTLRDLARGIYPPLLAAEGLAAALTAQAAKATLPIDVTADGTGRYSQDIEAAAYFCCLEALQNVAKYSGANHAWVNLRDDGGWLHFEIVDDGVGFDPAATDWGAGLQNMLDRADSLGGTVEIDSSPGQGTRLHGRLPTSA